MLVEHCAYSVQEIPEPGTFDVALRSPHAKEWKLAADSKYQSLIDNDTWDLVELPEGRTAVSCKWIFKLKYNGEGKVERFKSRLVAKGYSQRHGIDYEEIYMQQPDGYQVSGKESFIYRLKKSLYVFKQALRCWNQALKEFMMHVGFAQKQYITLMLRKFGLADANIVSTPGLL